MLERPDIGDPNDDMTKAFWAFHTLNPDVYARLRELALELRYRGRSRYGMKSLFEVLRWEYALQTTDEDFKLNNNYTAYYARLLMNNELGLRNFFSLRESRADSVGTPAEMEYERLMAWWEAEQEEDEE